MFVNLLLSFWAGGRVDFDQIFGFEMASNLMCDTWNDIKIRRKVQINIL